ncbi:MAG: radical SAM protein [Candidatus Eremiobacteraeota bacterium]|nr:radical SAM protein [Candidatus Eremiobacteraeota bacterium]
MTLKRFVAREEYFGSLIYDRQRCDYIPFDRDATVIFKQSSEGKTTDEIFPTVAKNVSEQNFKTFVQLCQSIELIDGQGHFVGDFISNPVEDGLQALSSPLRVHLQVTNECQLKCRHCSQDTRDAFQDELSLEEIKKLIDEMAAIGSFELNVGGGEPFLREDLVQIVAHARKMGISVSISTSGLFVSRVVAKKIAELGLKKLRISFDGATEKSYDYFRGKGTYRRAIRGIKTLRELFDIPIVVHTVLMKPNLSEMLTILRAVQKLRCTTWSVDFVKPVGSAKGLKQFLLDPADAAQAMKTIRRLAEASSIKIVMPQFPYKAPKKGIYRGFGCVGANLYCFVSARGEVKPCSFVSGDYFSGNIRQASLRELWQKGPGHQKFRELAGNENCLNCEFYNSCRGGCRARAIYEGIPDGVDPLCFVQYERPEPEPVKKVDSLGFM